MGIKNLFNAMKQEGYIIKKLDLYLLSLNSKDSDRATNVNSPSQVSNCMRANYYARMGYESDGSIEARTRRIFDNGTKTHERLQEYMLLEGMLISDEVPCLLDDLNIQGHTDGYLNLGKKFTEEVIIKKGALKSRQTITKYSEVGILEIKSINEHGYTQLKDAKEEHKQQAMVYLLCSEQRRLHLQEKYKNEQDFYNSRKDRVAYYESHYQHIQGGNKFSKQEKIDFQVRCGLLADDILFHTTKPISKVIFLYENKNNQDLKEFCVEVNTDILDMVCDKYITLNKYITSKKLPPREGTSKSCSTCRYCNYKISCFV